MADKKELTPEEQIKALQEQLAKSEAEKAEKAAQLNQVNAEKEAQAKQLAEAEAEKEEQAALIDEQNERLALAEASRGNKFPVVAHNKKKYQICAAKIQHPLKPGVTVTANELAQDKELIALLVKIKSGVLQEVVEQSK